MLIYGVCIGLVDGCYPSVWCISGRYVVCYSDYECIHSANQYVLQTKTLWGGSEEEMKKLESSLKNMLLVLTGVTAISVALLAYVNELTKGPIADANAKTLNEALKKFCPNLQIIRSQSVIPCLVRKMARRLLTLSFIRLKTEING